MDIEKAGNHKFTIKKPGSVVRSDILYTLPPGTAETSTNGEKWSWDFIILKNHSNLPLEYYSKTI